MLESIDTIQVTIHLGAEHTSFPVKPDVTLAAIKTEALNNLKIVIDPNIDYILQFEGQDVENEAETLRALLHDKLRKDVTFHIKKRPKGGSAK